MKPGLVTFIGGLALAIPAAIGLLSTGVPTALGPFPAMTALPAMFLSSRLVGIVVPSLIFFAWNPGLFRGENKPPTRSYGLLVVATILSVIWIVVGWKNGLHYQGVGYVHRVSVVTVAWIALLGTLFTLYWKRESFRLNLALHWLLFAWLAWYAFPYLGELP